MLFQNEQVALFALNAECDPIYAVENYDPIGQAYVMSRGIVGSLDGEPIIISPLYKQRFSLLSGKCFEQADKNLKVYEVRLFEDRVQLALAQ